MALVNGRIELLVCVGQARAQSKLLAPHLVDGEHSLEALILLAVPLVIGRRQTLPVRRQPHGVLVADLVTNVMSPSKAGNQSHGLFFC